MKKNTWNKKIIFPPSLYDDDEIFTSKQLKEEEERRKIEENDNPKTRPLPKEFEKIIYYSAERYGLEESEIYNELLEYYRNQFPGENASFLFPLGGFQMFNQIQKIFGRNQLIILGDKGIVELNECKGKFNPQISTHGGSLSFLSNFHALMKYWKLKNKENLVLLANSSHEFKVCCFIGGLNESDSFDTLNNFNQVNQFSPDDYYRIYRSIHINAKPNEIHSLLRLSCNDPGMFFQYKDILLRLLPKSVWKEKIIYELFRVWSNYYHRICSEDEDIPYALGEIFLACDRHDDALPFFKKSLKFSGSFYSTNYHIGLCYEKLGCFKDALIHYKDCKNSQIDVEIDDVDDRISFVQDIVDKDERKRKKALEKIEQQKLHKENEKQIKLLKEKRAIALSNSNTDIERSMGMRRTLKYADENIDSEEEESNEDTEDNEDSEDSEACEDIEDDYINPLSF